MAVHDSLMRWSFAVGRLDVHKFNDLLQLNSTFSPSVYKRVIFFVATVSPFSPPLLCLAFSPWCGTYHHVLWLQAWSLVPLRGFDLYLVVLSCGMGGEGGWGRGLNPGKALLMLGVCEVNQGVAACWACGKPLVGGVRMGDLGPFAVGKYLVYLIWRRKVSLVWIIKCWKFCELYTVSQMDDYLVRDCLKTKTKTKQTKPKQKTHTTQNRNTYKTMGWLAGWPQGPVLASPSPHFFNLHFSQRSSYVFLLLCEYRVSLTH